MPNAPTADDLVAMAAIVDQIVTDLMESNGVVPDRDYAAGALGSATVKVAAVGARYDDVEKVRALYNDGMRMIVLSIPVLGWHRHLKPAAVVPVKRVILSALVHEFTHSGQAVTSPADYAKAIALTVAFEARPKSPEPTAVEWLAEYYQIPGEGEAHAAQSAADVWHEHGPDLDQDAFESALIATEVHRRVTTRIGDPSFSAGAQTWWATFHAIAWKAYCSWR